MTSIRLLDRESKQILEEEPPAKNALVWLYKDNLISKIARFLLAHVPFLGWAYAQFQKSAYSKKSIDPFIEKYKVNRGEFLAEEFSTFSDFFERRLKSCARPIHLDEKKLISPADGRVKVIQEKTFDVKGKHFSLERLVKDKNIAKKFEGGKILTVRLAPQDYHRLHAPLGGKILSVKKMNGPLFSVSPIALKQNLSILHENKRVLLEFESYAMVLVGATFVGTIHLKVKEGDEVKKGDEIGHFSFGGSMCVLLLKEGVIVEEDLHFPEGEVLIKMGQPIASL